MILTRGYIEILKKTKIIYLKSEISYNCIDAFERCCKSKNDHVNTNNDCANGNCPYNTNLNI